MHNFIKFKLIRQIMLRTQWFSGWKLRAIVALEALWYGDHPLRWLLWPVAEMMQAVSALRRAYLQKKQPSLKVPIIVVGNISVGGVGKTPLVIALAQRLVSKGLRVGIVSRGYGAMLRTFPHEVISTDTARQVGDEPKLMAIKTQCPVVIAPRRLEAVDYLLAKHACQVIISDDGLQHYAMPRQIEIVVVDGKRGFGNGLCLPAGPLRESLKRLQQVDFIVINGTMSAQDVRAVTNKPMYHMDMVTHLPVSLQTHTPVAWSTLDTPVSVVAAIGHPERFFALFDRLSIAYQAYRFPDHHVYAAEELAALKAPIVMTEKDAVKCGDFSIKSMYYVPVEAKLSEDFWTKLCAHIL
jgi:tetraacyldisaccharide 4'-kinase